MDMEAGKTLTNEEVVRELLELLKKNAMKEQANDVFEICSYVGGLEKKIDSMTEELTNMQNQIKEMQEDTLVNNAKKALSEAQERLNARCEQIKSQILEVKAQVKSTAKSIVDEAKAKGRAALYRVSEFLGIKKRLLDIRENVRGTIKTTDKDIAKTALLAKGFREAGQTAANAFRTFADKPEVDYSQKEQKHPITKAVLAPMKAVKKMLVSMELHLDASIDKLDNLAMNVQLDKEKHTENDKEQKQTEQERAEAERVEAEVVYSPIDKFLGDQKPILAHKSIFEINRQLKSIDYTVKDMIYDYATDYSKWWLVSEHAQDIAKESRQYMCDYSQSMVLGSEESFSDSSYYSVTDKYVNISNWVWKRRDGAEKFSFDSEAEKDWAAILKDISASSIASVVTGKRKKNEMAGQKNLFGEIEKDTVINEKEVFLWGKNFVPESGIKFEYYLGAVHSSYPDFVMKDKFGRIHIFEVKSVNQSASFGFDNNIYISKVTELKKCYKQASIVTGHIFYLPIMKEDVWRITKYQNGIEETLTIDQFRNFVLNK